MPDNTSERARVDARQFDDLPTGSFNEYNFGDPVPYNYNNFSWNGFYTRAATPFTAPSSPNVVRVDYRNHSMQLTSNDVLFFDGVSTYLDSFSAGCYTNDGFGHLIPGNCTIQVIGRVLYLAETIAHKSYGFTGSQATTAMTSYKNVNLLGNFFDFALIEGGGWIGRLAHGQHALCVLDRLGPRCAPGFVRSLMTMRHSGGGAVLENCRNKTFSRCGLWYKLISLHCRVAMRSHASRYCTLSLSICFVVRGSSY
ncbi:hypothetical protein MRB53_037374 [Persea americana]|nr:hypothetical protein MRB53_037374 [Persea americana]